MILDVVPARRRDAKALAPKLRQEDKDEVWAASRLKPRDALLKAFNQSSRVRSCKMRGMTHGMFGVAPLSPEVGAPWFLGSPDLFREAWMEFCARTRRERWIEWVGEDFRQLWNFVDERNSVHIKWLQWAGFDFTKPVTLNGHTFWEFEKYV